MVDRAAGRVHALDTGMSQTCETKVSLPGAPAMVIAIWPAGQHDHPGVCKPLLAPEGWGACIRPYRGVES